MFSAAYIQAYKRNFALAWPVMLGQIGYMIAQLSDAMMVGKFLGTSALSAVSLGSSVFTLYLVLIMGVATGITTRVGMYHGNQQPEGVKLATSSGLWSMLLFCLPLMLGAYAFDEILYWLDWPTHVVELAIPYYRILCWSLLPLGVFMALKHYVDGLELTRPGMVVSIVANLVNVWLNYLLIDGNGGFEAYGLAGAGYATLISRWLMVVLMVAIIAFRQDLSQYAVYIPKCKIDKAELWQVLRLGIPIGLQYLLEAGAFIVGAIFVGWLGENASSAHHIALSVASFTFMFTSGFGATATIRMSNLLGKKDIPAITVVAKTLLVQVLFMQSVFALLIYLFNKELPILFVDDAEVLQIAAVLLVLAAIFQLMDGLQLLAAGLLRGASDVKIPTILAAICYWVVAVPLGYYLMMHTELKAAGIWVGFAVGLSLAALLLGWRFMRIMKEKILPLAHASMQ